MRIKVAAISFALAVACVCTAEQSPAASGSGGNGGGPSPCAMSGRVTYNGNPVKFEEITCHDSAGAPVTDTTDGNGNYQCTNVDPGTITLEARGSMAPACPDTCPDGGSAVCNPNVTGCGQPSVNFTLLLLPPTLFGRRAFKRLRKSHKVS